MSTPALKQITIVHLRGSVAPFSLPFEKGKKLTVVYGENGTGKSTICDAFEFLGKGRVGSLENRGLGRPNKYWPSLGKNSSDISVSLETADGATCTASLVKTDVVVTPQNNRPRVEVLRRGQILALVEAKPGERYSAISRFIDVSGIETSENNLRQLIQSLTKNREVAVARVQENEDAITQFWTAAGKPGTDALSWAKAEAKRDPNTADAETAALAIAQKTYTNLAEYPSQLKTVTETLDATKTKDGETRAALENCAASVSADAKEVVQILESARAYYHAHSEPKICPLCESSENAAGLSARIDKKLSSFSAVQTANSNVTLAAKALHRATEQLEQLRTNYQKSRTAFESARLALPVAEDIPLCSTPCPFEIDQLAAWLDETRALPAAWKIAETNRQDSKRFLATLRQALDTYVQNTDAQKELDALLPNLEKAHAIVVEERQKFTDSILSNIAAEVGRLYEAVHPGEGLNKISLELDPKKRASLEIGASFCGTTGTPPQAYFSESHLDTLGLCVFLALAALDGPAETILVLDDVLASVDEPHVEHLIEMLYAEATKFRHCVLTTHYRPWKQRLRWGWLQNGQCQFIELSKWTDTQGLILIRSVPDAESLRCLLAAIPPDPQLVCAKAGVILEAALTFLSQLYECKVPHRASNLYTLGDLLPSMNKKLREALIVEVLITDETGSSAHQPTALGPILDELHRIAQLRNVFGCHFNTLSFDMLESDAIGFGQQVLLLIDALADPNAGWPKSKKSGKYWATAGETRRLNPLLSPQ
jgi:energy-coupling factor transporter ATP-binding protein EcfA2